MLCFQVITMSFESVSVSWKWFLFSLESNCIYV